MATSSRQSEFYVYAYIRSRDSETAKAGTPYYIGKGKKKPEHSIAVSGKNNGRYDHSVRVWKSLADESELVMTMNDFCKHTGASISSASNHVHGKSKSTCGYILIKDEK